MIRGARQVGKSTLVQMFGKEFSNFFALNMVYRHHEYVIPIEVKSGEQGKLRSLHQFVEHAGHPYAVRLSANHLAVEKVKTPGGTNYLLLNLPYYLAAKIPEYLEWFIHNHKL